MRRVVILLAALVVLAACGGDDGGTARDIDLGDNAGNTTDGEGSPDDEAPADTPSGDEVPDDGAPEDEVSDDDAPEDEVPDGGDTADLVDLTEAVPGTWPVGDAGTVTFSIRDGALVLDEVTTTEGWESVVDEEDHDEIEVDFRRGNERWEIEIELEDGGRTLDIELRRDLRDAEPGSYDLGDAGTFAFAHDDGVLILTDLTPADGWTVTEQDEDGDEFDFELRSGSRRVDVEVELDDGRIEVEIDYRVVGPVQR